MADFAIIKDYLEAGSYATILLGLPVAIWQFIRSTRKEESDREYGTYNALDEKYIEFQRLCLEHSNLDIFDIPDAGAMSKKDIDKKQELIAFTMLFSIFERAYLMYYEQDNDLKARQWTGWHEYIIDYCKRENFRVAWEISGKTFDTQYQSFMQNLLDQCFSGKDLNRNP